MLLSAFSRLANQWSRGGGLATQLSGLGAPNKNTLPVLDILARYEAAKNNNPRVNSTIPSANIAFGDTPAAGTMGYANAGVVTTGYTMRDFMSALTNALPDNGGQLASATKPFRLFGAVPHNGGGGAAYVGLQGLSHYHLDGVTALTASTSQIVFVTDEPKPILWVYGSSRDYTLVVDDGTGPKKVVDSTITTTTNASFKGSSSGGYQYVQLDFSQLGGRKRRTFYLHCGGITLVRQVGISGVSTLQSTPLVSPQILYFTDSLGNTVVDSHPVNTGNSADSYICVVRDLLGTPDLFHFGEGQTGFIANNAGAGRTHLQKIQLAAQFAYLQKPAVIVMAASINDQDKTAGAITSAVSSCIAAAQAAWPGVPIIITGGSAQNNGPSYTKMIAADNAVKTALDGTTGVYFIDTNTASPGWQLGGGTEDNPAGVGNADLLFKNALDGTHFMTKGHTYWGTRMAHEIAGVLRSAFSIAEV